MRKLVTFVCAATFVAACGGGGSDSPTGTNPGTNPGTQTPTLDLAISGATVSVQQGATSGAVTLTITRGGGLTASVDLSVEGTPAGITPVLTPASVASGATSSVLTFVAGATAAVGTTNLTVRAKAAGVADKTAAVALTVTAAPAAGGFTLAAGALSGNVVQGASATSTITVARTGSFAGAVALTAAVTGSPSGVTATLNPTSVAAGSTTSTLTVAASGAATPGSYTVTISGTGTGASNQSVTVNANVTAAPPTSGNNATWTFCFASAPIWFAVQDGLASWARVTPGTNSDYKFSINSATGGVAYVTSVNGSFTMNIVYGTQAELIAQGATVCPGGSSKTVSGTFGGVTAGDLATVSLGTAIATGSGNTSFTLNAVPDGLRDLIASDAATVISGTSFSTQVKKMIIRRNQNPANNAVLPVLDFSAAEAFVPGTASITLANGGSDFLASTGLYFTANGAAGAFATDISQSATRTYYGVPSAQQAAGDLHGLTAVASVVNGSTATQIRTVSTYFKDLAAKTLTFGPAPSTVSVTSVTGTPVVRLRTQYAVQTEYNKFFSFSYSQAVGATQRTISITMSTAYLGGNPTSIDHTMPDLSTVAGWDNNWGLRAGTVTNYITTASGWTFAAGATGATPAEGGVILSGTKLGSFTP